MRPANCPMVAGRASSAEPRTSNTQCSRRSRAGCTAGSRSFCAAPKRVPDYGFRPARSPSHPESSMGVAGAIKRPDTPFPRLNSVPRHAKSTACHALRRASGHAIRANSARDRQRRGPVLAEQVADRKQARGLLVGTQVMSLAGVVEGLGPMSPAELAEALQTMALKGGHRGAQEAKVAFAAAARVGPGLDRTAHRASHLGPRNFRSLGDFGSFWDRLFALKGSARRGPDHQASSR